MRRWSDKWRLHFTKTLLGRLRLSISAEISGSHDMAPEPHEVRLFLMAKRRSKGLLGWIYNELFHLRTMTRIAWHGLERPRDFRWILHKLERQPHRETVFIEITDCPSPWPNITGVLIRCEPLDVGGFVYSLVYLDEEAWNERSTLGYAEIRARQRDPDVDVAVFSPTGYIHYSDFTVEVHADLAARLLTFLADHSRFRPVAEIAMSGAEVQSSPDGMDDPVFMELAQGVWKGTVLCSQLTVPLEYVRPHDPAFALSLPLDVAEPVLNEIRAGNKPAMAVYWNGDRFVMCDDYPVYLAYRRRDEDHVPVVVLGDYPLRFGPATQIGGPELFPDVMMASGPRSFDEETMDLLLESRIRGDSTRPGPVELYALHAHFCELLEEKGISERRIHEFLAAFPVIVDAYGATIRSELRLGSQYRVDLVLQYPTADRRTLLVELEAPGKELFTRAGRIKAPITHALQQVEDWLRWWEENPTDIPAGLDRGVPPDGLVIAGRNRLLSEEEKRRLVHLNQNRRVKLLTYDDLLDRLEEMIRNMELR